MKFHPEFLTDHEREVAQVAEMNDLQMTKDYRFGVYTLSVHTGTIGGAPMFADVFSADDTAIILDFLSKQNDH